MSFIYLTGGEKKRHKIFTRTGDTSTRPTPSIMREALFNMIDVRGKLFLDGFSGFGTVGLEALSRGANKVFFIELEKRNVDIIKKNLQKLLYISKATVIRKDIIFALDSLKGRELFDFIFLGPPYKNLDILRSVVPKSFKVLKKGGEVIIQYPAGITSYDFTKFGIILAKEKKYGSNKLLFYKMES